MNGKLVNEVSARPPALPENSSATPRFFLSQPGPARQNTTVCHYRNAPVCLSGGRSMRHALSAVGVGCLLTTALAASGPELPKLVCAARVTDTAQIYLITADGAILKRL